jgi:hypothetical protein
VRKARWRLWIWEGTTTTGVAVRSADHAAYARRSDVYTYKYRKRHSRIDLTLASKLLFLVGLLVAGLVGIMSWLSPVISKVLHLCSAASDEG